MRETNINESINRQDIKVGDKIVVSREVTVKAVRETTLHNGVDKPRRPITIITTEKDTIGITADETVKLLERDKAPIFTIPLNAVVITWKDDDGYDHLARRNSVSEEWVTSSEGPQETFTTDALLDAIEDGDFDGYEEGSFEVLKSKPSFANGGYVGGVNLGQSSIDAMTRLAQQNFLPRNVLASAALVP